MISLDTVRNQTSHRKYLSELSKRRSKDHESTVSQERNSNFG